jgi:glycosyl transferase family 25
MKSWPVYVINLDHAKRRLEKFNDRMNTLGLSYTRFTAVDSNVLSADTIQQSVTGDQMSIRKRPMTNAEIACYLSHIALWKKIRAAKSPAAFIFEDDAVLVSDAPEIMKMISSRPPDWDMLKLFSDKPKTPAQTRDLSDGYVYGVPKKHPMSTIAYVITRQAAAAMAENSLPFSLPIDMALKQWWKHEACIKLVQPNLCNPEDLHKASSNIEKYRKIVAKSGVLLHFTRNAKYQLQFKLASFRHRGQQPMKPRW